MAIQYGVGLFEKAFAFDEVVIFYDAVGEGFGDDVIAGASFLERAVCVELDCFHGVTGGFCFRAG